MNFSRGVGGYLSHLWKFRRGGGSSVAKMENPGRWGWWKSGYFVELHNLRSAVSVGPMGFHGSSVI